MFKDFNLNITIEVGLPRVNFPDVTLDLEKPYRKPQDIPFYVSSWSNYPPTVLKNFPLGINKRLSEISSTKEVFMDAIPPYQAALEKCGYNHKLVWMEEVQGHQKENNRQRSRRVIWFNPPHSVNVKTNMGKEFLPLTCWKCTSPWDTPGVYVFYVIYLNIGFFNTNYELIIYT